MNEAALEVKEDGSGIKILEAAGGPRFCDESSLTGMSEGGGIFGCPGARAGSPPVLEDAGGEMTSGGVGGDGSVDPVKDGRRTTVEDMFGGGGSVDDDAEGGATVIVEVGRVLLLDDEV